MRSLVIVGCEGAGKTVLVTCLAKTLSAEGSPNAFLDPQNRETQLYIDRIWSQLKSGEFPSSTVKGTLPVLHWKFKLNGNSTADVRVADPPGHDIRPLFQDASDQPSFFSSDLEMLRAHCQAADLAVVLISLKDFVGEPNLERRSANELVLKFALEFFTRRRPQPAACCLVITQADLFHAEWAELGSWLAVIQKYLPLVDATFLGNGRVPLYPIAAVNRTRVKLVEDGTAIRVPDKGFESRGLEPLIEWIKTKSSESWDQRLQKNLARTHYALSTKLREPAVRKLLQQPMLYAALLIVGFMIVFALGSLSPKRPPAPTKPLPKVVKKRTDVESSGLIWKTHKLRIFAIVKNEGASGDVTVSATLVQGQNERRRHQTIFIAAGELSPDLEFPFDEYQPGGGTFEVTAQ